MSTNTTQTLGAYRVGISFNPSGSEAVNNLKQKAADFIDACNELKNETQNDEAARCLAVAMTECESAAMWAVKGATKQ